MKKILIAGIGNIFHGDDAFGCEVLRHLQGGALPEGVTAIDFGIRSYDLAFALNDGYEAIILVDAAARGQPPGTLYLIEPEVDGLREIEQSAVDAHAMNPVSVIQMAQSFGGVNGKLYLVGCEPAVLESEGELGLSWKVQEAIPGAIHMIETLVKDILGSKETIKSSLAAA
jgi:hydrogenase maturation protease